MMNKLLIIALLCIATMISACANNMHAVNVLSLAANNAPNGFPMQALYVDKAQPGRGKFLGGSVVIFPGWQVAFTSKAGYKLVLDALDHQLLQAGFTKASTWKDDDTRKSGESIGQFVDQATIYGLNQEWLVTVIYWDYRGMSASERIHFEGGDMEGYMISIEYIKGD